MTFSCVTKNKHIKITCKRITQRSSQQRYSPCYMRGSGCEKKHTNMTTSFH